MKNQNQFIVEHDDRSYIYSTIDKAMEKYREICVQHIVIEVVRQQDKFLAKRHCFNYSVLHVIYPPKAILYDSDGNVIVKGSYIADSEMIHLYANAQEYLICLGDISANEYQVYWHIRDFEFATRDIADKSTDHQVHEARKQLLAAYKKMRWNRLSRENFEIDDLDRARENYCNVAAEVAHVFGMDPPTYDDIIYRIKRAQFVKMVYKNKLEDFSHYALKK